MHRTLSAVVLVTFLSRSAAAQPNPPPRGSPDLGCPCAICYCDTDWNRDCVVNQADIAMFIEDWFASETNGDTFTDWDASGGPSTADIAIFISTWYSDIAFCSQSGAQP